MARDGTLRRGTPGNHGGRPAKSLVDKVNAGKEAQVIDLPEPDDLSGRDMPPVKEYMKEDQKSGKPLMAEEVFNETWTWLADRGCEQLVSVQMVEQYAMAVARWIQCEQAISEYGFLAKHPTTGNAIASPYVGMSRDYAKQMNAAWYSIFEVVRTNSLTAFEGPTPQDDVMERLLSECGC